MAHLAASRSIPCLTSLFKVPLLPQPFNKETHSLQQVQEFARLFMAPGIAHCGTDTAPFFDALVDWVTKGDAPASLPLTVDDGAYSNHRMIQPN